MTEPTHLQELWMENELEESEAPAKARKSAVDVAIKRLVRRVRAIMKYAQGHCQSRRVKALLEPIEMFAASKTSDMSVTLEDSTLDVAEEEAEHGNVLPAIEQLEAVLHEERPAPTVVRKPKTVKDLLEDVRRLQQAA